MGRWRVFCAFGSLDGWARGRLSRRRRVGAERGGRGGCAGVGRVGRGGVWVARLGGIGDGNEWCAGCGNGFLGPWWWMLILVTLGLVLLMRWSSEIDWRAVGTLKRESRAPLFRTTCCCSTRPQTDDNVTTRRTRTKRLFLKHRVFEVQTNHALDDNQRMPPRAFSARVLVPRPWQ